MKEKIWNVPNILTIIRIALIGVLVYFFSIGQLFWALIVFVTAGVTDYLDGYIARKYNLITTFGKLMDPLADKLMVVTTLICLTTIGRVPLWAPLVIAVKETIMAIGGVLLLKRGIVAYAHWIGKAATILFTIAIIAVFFHEWIAPWDQALLVAAVLLSIAAFFWYLRKVLKQLNRREKMPDEQNHKGE